MSATPETEANLLRDTRRLPDAWGSPLSAEAVREAEVIREWGVREVAAIREDLASIQLRGAGYL